VRVERLNCADLGDWSIEVRPAALNIEANGTTWGVSSATTVWFRRLGMPDTSSFGADEAELAREELPHILLGGLDGCGVHWIDDPFKVERAERKLVQLSTATRRGLRIPTSLVTNDVDRARELLGSMRLVAKPLSPGQGIAPFVDEVTESDLGLVADLPVLVQELIADATADLRVVVVGSEGWVWRRARSADLIDWRAEDPFGGGFAHVADHDVVQGAVDMTGALGLTMSVQDWLETRAGPIFLEANPAGGWIFLAGAEELLVAPVASHLQRERHVTPAGVWPRPLARVGWDLRSAKKAPSRDGVKPPEISPPPWASLAARSPEALPVARRANDEAKAGAKAAEGKAARLTQTAIATLAVATAIGAYQVGFLVDREDWWWLTVLPCAGALACLGLAAFEALEIDRVGFYDHPTAIDLAEPGSRDPIIGVLEREEIGRHLASWSSENKHTALMQARAWFSRGLVLLVLAAVVAVVCRGVSTAEQARDDPSNSAPTSSSTTLAPTSTSTAVSLTTTTVPIGTAPTAASQPARSVPPTSAGP
jgi:hypothetical protein